MWYEDDSKYNGTMIHSQTWTYYAKLKTSLKNQLNSALHLKQQQAWKYALIFASIMAVMWEKGTYFLSF